MTPEGWNAPGGDDDQPPYPAPPGEPAPPAWGYPPPDQDPEGSAAWRYPPPPASSTANEGRPWTIAGLVCAIVALIFLPIVLGPLGAFLGFKGQAKGDPKGRLVGIGAIVATFVGMAISLAVMNSTTN